MIDLSYFKDEGLDEFEHLLNLELEIDQGKECRYCGCTNLDACIDPKTGETCHWIHDDVCSRCKLLAIIDRVLNMKVFS